MRLRPLPRLLLRMRLRLLPRLCPKLCGTETSSDDSTSTGYWPGNWLPSGTARGSTWWNAGGTNPTDSGQAERELGVGGGIELGVDGCTRHGELGFSGGAENCGSAELELGVEACPRHGETTAATCMSSWRICSRRHGRSSHQAVIRPCAPATRRCFGDPVFSVR